MSVTESSTPTSTPQENRPKTYPQMPCLADKAKDYSSGKHKANPMPAPDAPLDGEPLNDAIVFGDWPDAAVLDRPIAIALGAHKKAGRWKNYIWTVGDLFRGLSDHHEGQKDGLMWMPGKLTTNRRKISNVAALEYMVFDIDDGTSKGITARRRLIDQDQCGVR